MSSVEKPSSFAVRSIWSDMYAVLGRLVAGRRWSRPARLGWRSFWGRADGLRGAGIFRRCTLAKSWFSKSAMASMRLVEL